MPTAIGLKKIFLLALLFFAESPKM